MKRWIREVKRTKEKEKEKEEQIPDHQY